MLPCVWHTAQERQQEAGVCMTQHKAPDFFMQLYLLSAHGRKCSLSLYTVLRLAQFPAVAPVSPTLHIYNLQSTALPAAVSSLSVLGELARTTFFH